MTNIFGNLGGLHFQKIDALRMLSVHQNITERCCWIDLESNVTQNMIIEYLEYYKPNDQLDMMTIVKI